MNKNIAFDAKRLFENNTGLGNYSRTLVKNLTHFFPSENYHLFAPKFKINENTAFFLENTTFSLHKPIHSFGSYWRTFGINSDLQKADIDLFHGLSHEIPVGIKRTKIPTIVTIHDLIFKIYPDYYPTAQRWIYDWKFRYACENADIVVAISEQTKQDIIQYYGIAENKIRVVYQTCDERFQQTISSEQIARTKRKMNLPQDYMLYVGSIIERKNLLRIVQAMTQLPKNLDIPLVVIGEGKSYKEKVIDFVKENKLENRIIFIDKMIYSELPEVYAGASLFLYPSEYEGFGIPVIEALFMKTPVITSDCSCLPEAAGKDSILIPPTSVEAIADAIENILTDADLKNKVINKGYQHAVDNFSSKKVTVDMFSCYSELL
jgi:glycosyltransferase involved in cell wall biosynthesis